MLARVGYNFASRAFSLARTHAVSKSGAAQWAVASSTFAGLSLYFLTQKPIHNDVLTESIPPQPKPHSRSVGLAPLVWGSNQYHLLSSEQGSKEVFKFPTPMPELFCSPLRDLAFSTRHAACVDAAGDVYQWGDGFFGKDSTENRRPYLTLSGKNIVSLEITPGKIFALSSSGKIYALSSSLGRQEALPQNCGWNIFGQTEPNPVKFVLLGTDVALKYGERFISISAGSDHLLALTSRGRTFAHPITPFANCYGQLGLRKISVPDSTNSTKRLPIELNPKLIRDSNSGTSVSSTDSGLSQMISTSIPDGKALDFCDWLFEVPALRGVDVQQVATGNRTSFVVSRPAGRVLAWGANEYGQLGLGANITIPSVTVPTEVVLSRFTERGTSNRCVNIAAGGDLTLFTVEREPSSSGPRVFDVLACGNGQWGGLGNASYSNAQGTPVKVKNISGILEYEDRMQALTPLKPYQLSVAPEPTTGVSGALPSSSGHAIVTLDTFPLSHPDPKSEKAVDAARAGGRDIFVWGLNQQCQLGNGRRAGTNAPVLVPALGDDETDRLMCRVAKARVVDFTGRVVGRNMHIEQRAVAGPGVSIVYWKVV